MISELLLEIRENIGRFLEDEISLQEFEEWFVPVLWDLAESDDEESRGLAGTASNLIAEYSGGYRSEKSMREELASAIRPSVGGSIPVAPAIVYSTRKPQCTGAVSAFGSKIVLDQAAMIDSPYFFKRAFATG